MFKRVNLLLAVASLFCVGTAYAAREVPPVLFGLLSLPSLLAAFAGAGLILSFMPESPSSSVKEHFRILVKIAFCTLLGAVGAPVAVRVAANWVPALAGAGAEATAAFLAAAIIQFLMPVVIEHRGDFVGALVSRVRGG